MGYNLKDYVIERLLVIMKKLSLILCILWMGFIFYNSSESGLESNNKSKSIINQILYDNDKDYGVKNILIMSGGKSENTDYIGDESGNIAYDDYYNTYLQNINIILRKGAHLFEFLILAILVAWVMVSYEITGRRAVVYVLFIVLLYAVSDEFHQLFVPGRTARVQDILIDFIGGIIGTVIFYTLKSKFKLSKNKILPRV